MRQLFGLLIATGLWAATASAQDSDVHTFTLENGLQGVVIVDTRAPVVTNMVWYKVGSADEPPGKSGIAHYLEHLMFKGTDEIPEGAFSEIVAENGGEDNAFTSYDYTAYFQRIAKDRLPLMIEMEADRMTDLVLSEEIVIPELSVVLEERNQRTENDPAALFSEQRSAAQYLNHPYGRPIIGWKHEVSALSRQDAFDFYHTHYAPNNAILVVAGDVDPAEVEDLARQYFGPLAPSETLQVRTRPQEPPQTAARRMTFVDARVRQPYVTRGYLAPQRKSGDQQEAAALVMLSELLGSGITSYFTQKLEFDEKVAVNSGAGYSGNSLDPTTFNVYIVPATGVSLEEAESRLDAAIQSFLDEGPDAAHLARVKNEIKASQIYALDSQQGRARTYGAALTTGLTVQDVAEWPEILQDVTEDDVMNAARKVFRPEASVTGYLMQPNTAAEETQ